MAVAPVTDWRLYDAIYAERYMGHPAKQAEAYRRTSAVEAAENLNIHRLKGGGLRFD